MVFLRSRAVLLLTAIVVVQVSCTDGPARVKVDAAAPHVILVIIDTLRADHLPTYGYSRPTAPHLEALGERGWVFDQALAQSGWTLPATGSILSGLLPSEHGAVRDGTDMRRFGRFEPSTPTVAEAFSAAGYRTGAVVNNTFLAPDFGFQRGFDSYDYRGASDMEHRTAIETVDAGLAWLDADPSPAFAMLHFMEPHVSYAANKPERGSFAGVGKELLVPFPFHRPHSGLPIFHDNQAARDQVMGLYDEEILAADRGVGHLVRGLAKRGLTEKTWIFVTSDHGEELWDHGGFEHGHHLMGELVRVPLIAAGPGITHRRVAEPVAQVDIHATLVGLSGHRAAHKSHGVDLAWALGAPGRLAADRAIVAEDCLYGPWRSAVTVGRHRLQMNHKSGVSTLFTVDAQGQNDRLVQDGPGREEVAARLLEIMQRQRKGRGSPKVEWSKDTLDLDAGKLEQLRALGYVR